MNRDADAIQQSDGLVHQGVRGARANRHRLSISICGSKNLVLESLPASGSFVCKCRDRIGE